MNKEQKKQRYESILKLFKKPSSIKDAVENLQQHRLFCVECKILMKGGVMTRERGTDSTGRKTWLYHATTVKLSPLEATKVLKIKTDYSREKSMGRYREKLNPNESPIIRQKILDTFKIEMKASEARSILGYELRECFFRHIRILKTKGYLSESKTTSTGRNASYKTIIPHYNLDNRGQVKKDEPIIVKGYVNGVLMVSSNHYHPARMAKTSPRNYVSGSTLSMAV